MRDLIERIQDADEAELATINADPAVQKQIAWLGKNRPELHARVTAALSEARSVFETSVEERDGDLGEAA